MNILALDSSGASCGAAVYKKKLVSEAYLCGEKKHSETLMLTVESALNMAQLDKKRIDLLAVTNGPGSFTGLRIGLAVAKGMAQTLDIPCAAIDTLDVLKENISGFDGSLCPIIDARRGEVYSAVYSGGQVVVPKSPRPMSVLLGQLALRGEPVCFVGDGVYVHKQAIENALGTKTYFAPTQLLLQRAGALAQLAAIAGKDTYLDAYTLEAEYYRVSQAERLKGQREKK